MLPSKLLLRVTCLVVALVGASWGWLGEPAAAPVHLTPTFTQDLGLDLGGDGPPRVSVTLDHTRLAINGFVSAGDLIDFEVVDGPLRWPHALWNGGISLSQGEIASFSADATLGPGHFDCYGVPSDFCQFRLSGSRWSGVPGAGNQAAAAAFMMTAASVTDVAVFLVPSFSVVVPLQVPAPAPLASVLLGLGGAGLYSVWLRTVRRRTIRAGQDSK